MDRSGLIVWGIGTPRTLRVHWALHELGLSYETQPVITRTPMMEESEFLAVSPGKKIPALQHGDVTLTESAAIVRYLFDAFSGQSWTLVERATIDRLTFFALMEIDATALYVLRRHEGLPEIYGEAPAAVAGAYAYADRQFDVLAKMLGDNLFGAGNRFSVADIHLGTVLDWAAALNIQVADNLVRYRERLHERDAYQTARKANASATMPA